MVGKSNDICNIVVLKMRCVDAQNFIIIYKNNLNQTPFTIFGAKHFICNYSSPVAVQRQIQSAFVEKAK